jgi:hypothetical protein
MSISLTGAAFAPTALQACSTPPSTRMQGGRAVFENEHYRISAGDDSSVTIFNKQTGESYQVWGDPHVNVDGQHAFDFWGTTSFELEDGTQVTIDTTPSKEHPGQTLSSTVTITSGDYGVRISGVDGEKTGDLKIDEAAGWGGLLDAVTADGNRLYENPLGKGFIGVGAGGVVKQVDQAFIDQTDLVKNKSQALEGRLAVAFDLLGGLVAIAFTGVFLSALGGAVARTLGHRDDRPEPDTRRTSFDSPERRPNVPDLRAHLDLRITLA